MRKAPVLRLLAFGLVVGWLFFLTEYEFTTYPVEGCAQPVTAITYSKAFHRGRLFSRGVAFVRGEYRTREIPSRDCVILPHLSGFDAYFEAILTCENGTIVVNSSDGLLESPSPSKAIVFRALSNPDYLRVNALKNPASILASGGTFENAIRAPSAGSFGTQVAPGPGKTVGQILMRLPCPTT